MIDPATGKPKVTLVTDLLINVGSEVVKAVSTMSTDIDLENGAAVVDTTLEITGPDGETHVHSGKLDLAVADTCVTATLSGDDQTQQTHVEIQDVTFCADGSACVYGATLRGPDRELILDLHPGGGSSFSFNGPNVGAQKGELPVDVALCVELW